MSEPGWYPDPSGQHEQRFWDGRSWTGKVARGGVQFDEAAGPPGGGVPPAPGSSSAGLYGFGGQPASGGWPVAAEAEPAGPAEPVEEPGAAPYGSVVGMLGAVVVAVAAFLPWATVTGPLVTETKAGISGDGILTLVLAIGMGLFALLSAVSHRGRVFGVLVALGAGLIGLIAAIDIADVNRIASNLGVEGLFEAGVGIGLWLTAAGAALAFVGGILAAVLGQRS